MTTLTLRFCRPLIALLGIAAVATAAQQLAAVGLIIIASLQPTLPDSRN